MEWRTIDFAPNYEVSEFGDLRRKDGKTISQWQLNNGYLQTQFNTRKKHLVHRIVAHAFMPEYEFVGAVVRHLDNNKENNHYKNLEWCEQSTNVLQAYAQGRHSKQGERHHLTKFRNNDILDIRLKRESGLKYSEIAAEYGVKQGTIAAICRHENWNHI